MKYKLKPVVQKVVSILEKEEFFIERMRGDHIIINKTPPIRRPIVLVNVKRSLNNCPNFSKRTLKERNLAVPNGASFANRLIQSSLKMSVSYRTNHVYVLLVIVFEKAGKEVNVPFPLTLDFGHKTPRKEVLVYG